jgi:acylphosphatase
MKQAHVYISGFVQGVGYRAYVRSKARKLGLVGWVRNLSDERVEGVFQGEKEVIEKLLKLCRRGPFFANVKDIVVDWEDAQETFLEFKKLPTV